MAEYFFTDPDLLLSQTEDRLADRFGSVDTFKYSVTSLHRGAVIPFKDPNDPDGSNDERGPDAFAVVNGQVLAFEITDLPVGAGTGAESVPPRYNIVLKPSHQGEHSDEKSVPKVKFFIYRGILSKSLPPNIPILSKYIMDTEDREVFKGEEKRSIESLFLNPVKKTDASDEIKEYKPVAVKAGDTLGNILCGVGLENVRSFGFEIMLDNIGFEPTADLITETGGIGFKDEREGSSRKFHRMGIDVADFVNVASVPGLTDAEKVKLSAFRNRIHNYIDPCAYFGQLDTIKIGRRLTANNTPLKTTIGAKATNGFFSDTDLGSFESIDGRNNIFRRILWGMKMPVDYNGGIALSSNTLRPLSNTIGPIFLNRNRVYINIQNELGDPISFDRSYESLGTSSSSPFTNIQIAYGNGNGNKRKYKNTPSETAVRSIKYAAKDWPILIIEYRKKAGENIAVIESDSTNKDADNINFMKYGFQSDDSEYGYVRIGFPVNKKTFRPRYSLYTQQSDFFGPATFDFKSKSFLRFDKPTFTLAPSDSVYSELPIESYTETALFCFTNYDKKAGEEDCEGIICSFLRLSYIEHVSDYCPKPTLGNTRAKFVLPNLNINPFYPESTKSGNTPTDSKLRIRCAEHLDNIFPAFDMDLLYTDDLNVPVKPQVRVYSQEYYIDNMRAAGKDFMGKIGKQLTSLGDVILFGISNFTSNSTFSIETGTEPTFDILSSFADPSDGVLYDDRNVDSPIIYNLRYGVGETDVRNFVHVFIPKDKFSAIQDAYSSNFLASGKKILPNFKTYVAYRPVNSEGIEMHLTELINTYTNTYEIILKGYQQIDNEIEAVTIKTGVEVDITYNNVNATVTKIPKIQGGGYEIIEDSTFKQIYTTIYLVRGIGMRPIDFCKYEDRFRKEIQRVWHTYYNKGLNAKLWNNDPDIHGGTVVYNQGDPQPPQNYLISADFIRFKYATPDKFEKLKDDELLVFVENKEGRAFAQLKGRFMQMYAINEAAYTAPHEFGHIMGLSDRYTRYENYYLNGSTKIINFSTLGSQGGTTRTLYLPDNYDIEYTTQFRWRCNLMSTLGITASSVADPPATYTYLLAPAGSGVAPNFIDVPSFDPLLDAQRICIFITEKQCDCIIDKELIEEEEEVQSLDDPGNDLDIFRYVDYVFMKEAPINSANDFSGTFVGYKPKQTGNTKQGVASDMTYVDVDRNSINNYDHKMNLRIRKRTGSLPPDISNDLIDVIHSYVGMYSSQRLPSGSENTIDPERKDDLYRASIGSGFDIDNNKTEQKKFTRIEVGSYLFNQSGLSNQTFDTYGDADSIGREIWNTMQFIDPQAQQSFIVNLDQQDVKAIILYNPEYTNRLKLMQILK